MFCLPCFPTNSAVFVFTLFTVLIQPHIEFTNETKVTMTSHMHQAQQPLTDKTLSPMRNLLSNAAVPPGAILEMKIA